MTQRDSPYRLTAVVGSKCAIKHIKITILAIHWVLSYNINGYYSTHLTGLRCCDNADIESSCEFSEEERGFSMSSFRFGLTLLGLCTLTACSTPQKIIHPVSNPELTQLRGKIDHVIDTYRMRGWSMGSYLFPTEGSLFQPVPVTDARNAIIYIYRPHSSWNDEEVIAPSIFLNGRRLHGIRDSAYYWMELPAGRYDFAARRPIGPVYLTYIFNMKLQVEDGRAYYFRYDEENYRPQPDKALGLIKQKYLTELPEEMAMKEIREMRLDKPGFGFATASQSRWKPFDLYADGEHPVPKERLEAEKDLHIGNQVLMWKPSSW